MRRPVKLQQPSLSGSSIRLIELAGRPGGVSAGEANGDPEVKCGNVGDQLYQLFKRGHVARARDGKVYRYFHTVQAAEAFEAAQGPVAEETPEEPWQPYQPAETFVAELHRLRAGGMS